MSENGSAMENGPIEGGESRPRSSLRVAVAGKGGAGKTTFSATLARLMARRGKRVIVIDGDSNPNVAVALGSTGRRRAPSRPCPPP